MYILSVTFVVEPTAEARFREVFGQRVRPLLEGRRVTTCRVLSEKHEGHFTFSMQIDIEALSDFSALRNSISEIWAAEGFGEDVLWFSTLLKREEF